MPGWDERWFGEGAAAQARRVKAGEATAAEMARAYGARLAGAAAVRESWAKPAERLAKDLDKEFKRGKLGGPLRGAPCGVSEAFGVAASARDEDSTVVRRLKKSKALVMARLAGQGGVGAVAAGLLPVAVEMDRGGDILQASAKAGLVALRPTFGTVSRFGAGQAAWTVDTVAVTARAVEDCGWMVECLSGADARDGVGPGRGFHYVAAQTRAVESLSVMAGGGVRADGVGTVKPLGRLELPAAETLAVIVAAERAASQGEGPGLEMKAVDYLQAMRVRRMIGEWLAETMAGVDYVVISFNDSAAESWMAALVLAGWPVAAVAVGGDGGKGVLAVAGRPRCENLLLFAAQRYQGVVR